MNCFPKIEFAGFADAVKDQCHRLYGWAGVQDRHFYDEPENAHLREVSLPLLEMSPRDCWIGYANRVRDFREGTWRDYLLHTTTADFLVIKDMRFPKELRQIQELGGHCIKVERPSVIRTGDEADDALLGYKGWDATIVNDGSLQDLNRKVIHILETLCLSHLD